MKRCRPADSPTDGFRVESPRSDGNRSPTADGPDNDLFSTNSILPHYHYMELSPTRQQEAENTNRWHGPPLDGYFEGHQTVADAEGNALTTGLQPFASPPPPPPPPPQILEWQAPVVPALAWFIPTGVEWPGPWHPRIYGHLSGPVPSNRVCAIYMEYGWPAMYHCFFNALEYNAKNIDYGLAHRGHALCIDSYPHTPMRQQCVFWNKNKITKISVCTTDDQYQTSWIRITVNERAMVGTGTAHGKRHAPLYDLYRHSGGLVAAGESVTIVAVQTLSAFDSCGGGLSAIVDEFGRQHGWLKTSEPLECEGYRCYRATSYYPPNQEES